MVKTTLSKSVKAQDSDSCFVGSTPTTSTNYVVWFPVVIIWHVVSKATKYSFLSVSYSKTGIMSWTAPFCVRARNAVDSLD